MDIKLPFFVVFMLLSSIGFSQSNFSIELLTGYDKNISLYDDLYGENYSSLPDFNAGFNVSYYLGKRIRLKTEFKYINNSYTRVYNNASVPSENIHLSKMAINSIDITPRVDYRLASINKYDFYFSGGIRFEKSFYDFQKSVRYNGDIVKQGFIADKHKNYLFGGIGGFNIKYNVSQKLALSFAPEYTYFFGKYYDKNDNNFQRCSLNIGAEWRF